MEPDEAHEICDILSDICVINEGSSVQTWSSEKGVIKLLGAVKDKEGKQQWMIYYRNIPILTGTRTQFFDNKPAAIKRIRELLR